MTGEGVEARGTGSVKLALAVRLTERDGGTAITFEGTVSGDGRLVELDAEAALAAAHRLLDRFAQQLVTEALAAHGGGADGSEGGSEDGAGGESVGGSGDGSVTGADERSVGDAVEKAIEEAAEEADDTGIGEAPPRHDAAADEAPAGDPSSDGASVFDAAVPPSSLDPVAGIEFTVPDGPPAEAAHARRTMIGRSAEEVDHAPPRGRYAPVPAARLDRCGRHAALGGPGRRARPRLGRGGGPGAAAPEVVAPVVSSCEQQREGRPAVHAATQS